MLGPQGGDDEFSQGFNLVGQKTQGPELSTGRNLVGQSTYPTTGFTAPMQGRFSSQPQGRFSSGLALTGALALKKNPLLGAGIGLGVDLLGAGLNYLGSGDQRRFAKEQRQNARWAWGKAKSAYGTDVINPGQTMWATHAAGIPRMNELGAGLDRRYGFDSGRAGGYLAEQQLSTEAQAWLDAYLQNAGLKTSRDTNILGMLGG